MSIWLAAGVIAACVAAAVLAMYAVRRSAPAGGHFRDSDRASGVFGFVGAGFGILLGFVVLVTFEGYRARRRTPRIAGPALGDADPRRALLASPFQGGNGSVRPNGMRFTLQLIRDEAAKLNETLAPPCDAAGRVT